jgi:hypothetical protein
MRRLLESKFKTFALQARLSFEEEQLTKINLGFEEKPTTS